MVDFIKRVGIISKNFRVFTRQSEDDFSFEISPKELLFNDFLELIYRENCLFANDVAAAKRDFKMIQNEPECYLKKLVGNDAFNGRYYDNLPQFLYYNLLKEYMFQFEGDIWKYDIGGLSKFVKEGTDFSFEIRNKESENGTILKKKRDTHTAYTLLNIDGEMDNYNLFLCKKQDKKKFLELVGNLGFPIVEL